MMAAVVMATGIIIFAIMLAFAYVADEVLSLKMKVSLLEREKTALKLQIKVLADAIDAKKEKETDINI